MAPSKRRIPSKPCLHSTSHNCELIHGLQRGKLVNKTDLHIQYRLTRKSTVENEMEDILTFIYYGG